MTPKTKAAIEEAAESIPKPIGDMLLNVPHVITQNGAYYHYSDVCSAIESHTAAHTAALRERVKELEGILNQVVYEYEQGEQSFKTILEIKEVLKNG